MTHARNKVEWCLKKAEKELESDGTHRGLVKITLTKKKIDEHIQKAEHDLKAGIHFNEAGFSDWSASAFFYAVYHALLAIATKFGYASRNQECTFALIAHLIEEKKIGLEPSLLDAITSLEQQQGKKELTSVALRETLQYGTKLSLDDTTYESLLDTARKVLSSAKEIVET